MPTGRVLGKWIWEWGINRWAGGDRMWADWQATQPRRTQSLFQAYKARYGTYRKQVLGKQASWKQGNWKLMENTVLSLVRSVYISWNKARMVYGLSFHRPSVLPPFLLFFLDTRSRSIAQPDLEFMAILLRLPKCWDYKYKLPHQTWEISKHAKCVNMTELT